MSRKEVLPSVTKTAFSCPHCGAYTTQHWSELAGRRIIAENPVPPLMFPEAIDNINNSDLNDAAKESALVWIKALVSGEISIQEGSDHERRSILNNLYLSECYHCKKFSIWVYDRLVYPSKKEGPEPNEDLPEDIIRDFEEARTIVNLSPRGAAALLRLCVQKLCLHLKAEGKSIDENIKYLVSQGLAPLVQKSLDIVRVIGNEAVHPGVIDLKDDRDTANELFGLINAIADQMISHPKSVATLYEKLPAEKRAAIEKRDGKTKI